MLDRLNNRIKRIERALGDSLGADISTPRGRRRAVLHYQLLDHGLLRALWANFHPVAPGVWRANQPSPRRLRTYRRMGITTVLNLRGKTRLSPYLFEEEACRELGLKLVNHSFQARALCHRSVVLRLLDLFETIERPFLMHCKSGADRAGLASALYLMHVENVPVEIAKRQLGLKYIHLPTFKTGVLDHMLEAYERDNRTEPMPIRKWIETRYDPVALTEDYQRKRARP